MITHGMSGTRAYFSWWLARSRCYNKKDPSYANYGGRGISMCARWRNDVMAFFSDMGERPKGWTIERIDNDGNYEPENCCWLSREDQQLNRRFPAPPSTGYRYIYQSGNRFRVRVRRRKDIGIFGSINEAIAARDMAMENCK